MKILSTFLDRNCCAAALALALASPVVAQAPTPPATGVVTYNPDFFSQARPQNALEMVQRVPGFAISAPSLVRGYAGAAGNVLIDGKQPVSKNEAVMEILTRIQASAVERIDLIRGGAPGIDMAGRSVVVNVIRKRGSGLRQTATANAWGFADGRVLPGFRYDLSRQVSGDQGYELTLDSNGTYTDSWGSARRVRRNASGSIIQDIGLDIVGDGRASNARGNLKHPVAGGVFQVSGNISRQTFADRQLLKLPAGEDDFRGDLKATNGELSVDYSREIADDLKGQILVLQRMGSGFFSSEARLASGFATDFRRREKDGETIVRNRYDYALSRGFEVEAGLEGAFNFLEGRTEYQENGVAIPLPSEDARVEEYRGEIFAKGSWKPSSQLAVEAGGRMEISRINLVDDGNHGETFTYAKPRATISWTPRQNSQLRFRVEREVGQLSFGDFIASAQLADDRIIAGNVNLRPQTEWVFEAAAEQRFWSKGAITFTLRHRRFSDVVDVIAIDDEFEAVGNIGSGTGLDAIATFTAPLDKILLRGLTVRANGTWRNSKVTDPITGQTRRISGQRPFEGSVGFTHDVEPWNLSYGFDANAGWRERYWRLSELTTSSLTRWFRLFAEYKPTPSWSVRAEYVNLDEYRRQRTIFTGLREESAISFVESRVIPPPPRFNVRVRRSF